MYASGVLVAFILVSIIQYIQEMKKRQDNDYERLPAIKFLASLLMGSIFMSLGSWLTVIIFIGALLMGKVCCVSERNYYN